MNSVPLPEIVQFNGDAGVFVTFRTLDVDGNGLFELVFHIVIG